MRPDALARALLNDLLMVLAPALQLEEAPYDRLVQLCVAELASENFFGPLFSLYAMSHVAASEHPFAVPLDDGATIIDLGSGVGRYAVPLARRGQTVLGIEQAPFGRSLQQSLAEALRIPLSCRAQVDVRGPSADAVLCLFSTITDPAFGSLDDFFRVARSLLRPGGLLLLDAIPAPRHTIIFPEVAHGAWDYGRIHKRARHRSATSTTLEWTWATEAGPHTYSTHLVFPTEDALLVIADNHGFHLSRRHDLDEHGSARPGIEWTFTC